MIVHHTGKDAAKGARGHSSLRAATDTEIELVADESGNRYAKVTKQRDYEGGEKFFFDLKPVILGVDQDGDEVSTCVVSPIDQKKSAVKNPLPPMEVCKRILREIQSAWGAKNPYSTAPQTKRTERYAARSLGKQFNVAQAVMENLLLDWVDNGVIKMEIYDTHAKKKGLKVLEKLS
jgi:hypothetical protein